MYMLGDYDHMIDVVSTDDIDMSKELAEAIANSDYETIDYLWDYK